MRTSGSPRYLRTKSSTSPAKLSLSFKNRRWPISGATPPNPLHAYSTGKWVMAIPALPRRRDDAIGHLGGRVVGIAVGLMVQVVELAHCGVAGLQHFHVQLCGDVLGLLGIDAFHEGVHTMAPGPEAVLVGAPGLGKSGHGTLEGVGMHIGHARDRWSRQAFGIFRWLAYPRRDGTDEAGPVDFQEHVIGPSVAQ